VIYCSTLNLVWLTAVSASSPSARFCFCPIFASQSGFLGVLLTSLTVLVQRFVISHAIGEIYLFLGFFASCSHHFGLASLPYHVAAESPIRLCTYIKMYGFSKNGERRFSME
jgi:hypothetical protein